MRLYSSKVVGFEYSTSRSGILRIHMRSNHGRAAGERPFKSQVVGCRGTAVERPNSFKVNGCGYSAGEPFLVAC